MFGFGFDLKIISQKAASHVSIRNQDVKQKDHVEAVLQTQGEVLGVLWVDQSTSEVKALVPLQHGGVSGRLTWRGSAGLPASVWVR